MDGEDAFEGDILVRSGRIAAIGKALKAPRGVSVIEAAGMQVLPGFIDGHSRFLLIMEGPSTAKTDGNVLDLFDYFQEEEMAWALSRGVTAAALSPPSVTGFSGRIAVVKLLPKADPEKRLLRKDAALKAGLGIGMLGNAIARLKSADAIENQFKAAKKYRESWEKYEEELEAYLEKLAEKEKEADKKEKKEEKSPKKKGEEEKGDGKKEKKEGDPEKKEGKEKGRKERPRKDRFAPPGDNPGERGGKGGKPDEKKPAEKKKEALKKPKKPTYVPANEFLLKAMDGELAVHFEVHRAADILWALDLKRRFHLDLVLVGCTEGYRVAEEIEAAGVPVILGAVMRQGVRKADEFFNQREDLAAILAKEGIPLTLAGSGRRAGETRFLAFNAALAVRGGLCPGAALEAITIQAARTLGVADRIGSLERGKDADIVLFDGDPLTSDAVVKMVLINGRIVYRADGG